MSTPAQTQANRDNAKKSTGPRTAEGKARSAQNARDHGLTGRDLVIGPGEEQEFDEMQAGLFEEIKPEGTIEDELFKAFIHAAWNQRRCRRAEAGLQTNVAAQGLDPLLDPTLDSGLKRLDLYARRAAGAFHRNMKALRDRQNERHTRVAVAAANPGAPDFSCLGLAGLASARQALLKERTQLARSSTAQFQAQVAAIDLEIAQCNARCLTQNAA